MDLHNSDTQDKPWQQLCIIQPLMLFALGIKVSNLGYIILHAFTTSNIELSDGAPLVTTRSKPYNEYLA